MPRLVWTPEMDAALYAGSRDEAYVGLPQLAERIGVCVNALRTRIKRLGVKRRKQGRARQLTAAELAMIVEARTNPDVHLADVAKRLGKSVHNLCAHATYYRVPVKCPHNRPCRPRNSRLPKLKSSA